MKTRDGARRPRGPFPGVLVLLALAVLAGPRSLDAQATYTLVTPGTAAQDAGAAFSFRSTSADGSKVFFLTAEALVASDQDTARDLYMAEGGVVTLLSGSTTGQVNHIPVTARRLPRNGLGDRVLFSTTERLVAADVDATEDVYEASGGTVRLRTGGVANVPAQLPEGGDGDYGVSDDLSRIFFLTTEAIPGTGDTDSEQDIYMEENGVITLLTGGASPTGAQVTYEGNSPSGDALYFSTAEALTASDLDTTSDLYRVRNGVLSLITPAGNNPVGADASFDGASVDGSRVIFTTADRILPGPGEDEDINEDCYMWTAGTGGYTLISGPSLYPAPDFNGATCRGITTDGTRIFFESTQNLVGSDSNGDSDGYVWSGGALTLLGTGAPGTTSGIRAFSADGSRVVLATTARLASGDTDNAYDQYLLAGGTATLLTAGTTQLATCAALSPDLSRCYLYTTEALDPDDTDTSYDTYEGSGGQMRLLTPGTTSSAALAGVSADGSIVVIGTVQSLDPSDTDANFDLYRVSLVTPDTEPPVITIAVSLSDGVAPTGWYNAASSGIDGVLVHVSATDATAVTNITAANGNVEVLNTSSASGTFSLGDGQASVSATASDGLNVGAGPGSTPMPVLLDIDQRAPSVTCNSPTVFVRSTAPLVVATVSDATSGPLVDTLSIVPDPTAIGVWSAAVTGADIAGNQWTQSCPYRAVYDFAGFGAPVSSPPNQYVNAVIGANIPLRFVLRDAQGAPVLGVSARSVQVTDTAAPGQCTGTSSTLVPSDYVRGRGSLVEIGGGAYEYRFRAPRTDAGQCRRFSLTLADGVEHVVLIQFAP